MADIVTEMNLYGAPDDSTAFAEPYYQPRLWMSLEDLTSNPYMIEVNHLAYMPLTLDQAKFVNEVYNKTLAAVRKNKWYIEAEAIKSGYVLIPDFDEVHYPNKEFFNDGKIFDPERPEYLIFHPTVHGRVLVGVMFQVESHLATGPQLGGNQTVWHFHTQPGSCWEHYLRIAITSEKNV